MEIRLFLLPYVQYIVLENKCTNIVKLLAPLTADLSLKRQQYDAETVISGVYLLVVMLSSER